ncbi:MAG: hypothetical protein COA50_03405 [Flavobacteriaceae bacterium]|nr:MAG: hypothetical protein COA50_03405 [Flavobacteriaceae bacterium]
MMPIFLNSIDLLTKAEAQNLYHKLIEQLHKDFNLANVLIEIPKEITPKELREVLHEKIYYLILEKFTEYVNLLYVVDVPEKNVKEITAMDVVDISEQVTFLILKREMQKVWFKSKYTS